MAPRARRDESPRQGNIRGPRCCPCFHLAGDSGVNLIPWDLRLTCLLAHRELELVCDVRWEQRHLGSRIPYSCLTGVDALLAGVAARRKCITSNRRTRRCTHVSSIVNSWATRGVAVLLLLLSRAGPPRFVGQCDPPVLGPEAACVYVKVPDP